MSAPEFSVDSLAKVVKKMASDNWDINKEKAPDRKKSQKKYNIRKTFSLGKIEDEYDK